MGGAWEGEDHGEPICVALRPSRSLMVSVDKSIVELQQPSRSSWCATEPDEDGGRNAATHADARRCKTHAAWTSTSAYPPPGQPRDVRRRPL